MGWGPFAEKGDGTKAPSMTRLVAFLFTLVYCATLLISAKTSATSMGWPFAALGIVVILAVPLQALFRSLQSWLKTPSGKKVLDAIVAKAAASVPFKSTSTIAVESGEPG